MNWSDRENTKGRGGLQWESGQIQLKSQDFDKNIILSDVPCGQFALGTLSQICLKDDVFDLTVRQQKLTKWGKSKNFNIDMKIKSRIITKYHFDSQLHILIYVKSNVWTFPDQT